MPYRFPSLAASSQFRSDEIWGSGSNKMMRKGKGVRMEWMDGRIDGLVASIESKEEKNNNNALMMRFL